MQRLHRLSTRLVLVATVLLGCREIREPADGAAGLPAPPPLGPDFVRGVSLGLFASESDPVKARTLYRGLLEEIRAHGATDLQIVVRLVQEDIFASELVIEPALSPSLDLVAAVMADARTLGLRVLVFPIVHLRRAERRQWRGVLAPKDEVAWWSSYRARLLELARLAEREKAYMLSIGSELLSLESKQESWRALAQEVRAVFGGRLTYSANWDHFEPIQFWDALDVVGVTAYQPLSARGRPDEEALIRGFAPFLGRLRSWAGQHGHRYLLTEVGYPSHELGAERPWDHGAGGKPDPELQRRCYRALYRVFREDPRLSGLYVWNWFGFGGLDDPSYTPRRKPAADVLRRWYLPAGG